MSDNIDALKEIKATLDEEIKARRIEISNLNAQAHQANVQNEQEFKLKEAQLLRKESNLKNDYAKRDALLAEREQKIELLEKNVKQRIGDLEDREALVAQWEEKRVQLLKERSNFLNYKASVEKELESAQETIMESKELKNALKAEEDSLEAREISIREKEKYWNDTIGQLEQERKIFSIEKENYKALSKEEIHAH